MVAQVARRYIAVTVFLLSIGCGATPTSPQMSFFVTSQGLGRGGDLGGIAGADTHCQQLAAAVGSHRTWHAYLSAPGSSPVNARERIGSGPWFNAVGTQIAANIDDLHRNNGALTRETLVTEQGKKVAAMTHDMLTGSTEDGRLMTGARDSTCHAWTSRDTGGARVGHSDRAVSVEESRSWNSAHTTDGCSAKALDTALGAGLFYCFAVD